MAACTAALEPESRERRLCRCPHARAPRPASRSSATLDPRFRGFHTAGSRRDLHPLPPDYDWCSSMSYWIFPNDAVSNLLRDACERTLRAPAAPRSRRGMGFVNLFRRRGGGPRGPPPASRPHRAPSSPRAVSGAPSSMAKTNKPRNLLPGLTVQPTVQRTATPDCLPSRLRTSRRSRRRLGARSRLWQAAGDLGMSSTPGSSCPVRNAGPKKVPCPRRKPSSRAWGEK